MTPDHDDTVADKETATREAANQMGPAGLIADNNIGLIVSGQPIGGPNDLGKKAHDEGEKTP